MHKDCSPEDWAMNYAYSMEEGLDLCRQQSEKHGKHIEDMTILLDMSTLSMSALPMIPYVTAGSKIGELYYPETIGNLIAFNCPWVFPFLCKFYFFFLSQIGSLPSLFLFFLLLSALFVTLPPHLVVSAIHNLVCS